MNNDRHEIDQYLAMWDQAKDQFPKEKKSKTKSNNSFFGMHSLPEELPIGEEEGDHWRDVYHRSLEIDPDDFVLSEGDIDQQCLAGMMDVREAKEAKAAKKKPKKKTEDRRKPQGDDAPEHDEEKDGFGKDLAKKLGDVEFTPNPVHFASVGADSDLRVTPNWTDGKELRALDKMKRLLHDLESEFLGTDVRGGDPEPIRLKIVALKRQCEALSQSLIPDPKKDVS